MGEILEPGTKIKLNTRGKGTLTHDQEHPEVYTVARYLDNHDWYETEETFLVVPDQPESRISYLFASDEIKVVE